MIPHTIKTCCTASRTPVSTTGAHTYEPPTVKSNAPNQFRRTNCNTAQCRAISATVNWAWHRRRVCFPGTAQKAMRLGACNSIPIASQLNVMNNRSDTLSSSNSQATQQLLITTAINTDDDAGVSVQRRTPNCPLTPTDNELFVQRRITKCETTTITNHPTNGNYQPTTTNERQTTNETIPQTNDERRTVQRRTANSPTTNGEQSNDERRTVQRRTANCSSTNEQTNERTNERTNELTNLTA